MPSISWPLRGKPAPIELGLFLFSPSSVLKVSGETIRGLFIERNEESLYKGLIKLRLGHAVRISGIFDGLRRLLSQLPLPSKKNTLFYQFSQALNEKTAFPEELDTLGDWEKFWLARDSLEPHQQYIVSIERCCYRPGQLLKQGNVTDALQLLLGDALMESFFWPEAIAAFQQTTRMPISGPMPVQVSIALEVQLSILACLDTFLMSQHDTTASWFLPLLPTEKQNCNARFFRWLKGDAPSIEAWLNQKSLLSATNSPDISTAKRWSSGASLPSHKHIEELADILSDEPTTIQARHWATTYLNLLVFVAETYIDRSQKAATEEGRNKWLPWPTLPFGHPSINVWLHTRYAFWLQYHQARANS